jgi:hypothetical protein
MSEYQITPKGLVIGEPLRGYRALTSGIPGPWSFESDDIPKPRAAPPEHTRNPGTARKRKEKPNE